MSASPLVNLAQAIHLPSHRFLLTTSSDAEISTRIVLHLFIPTPVSDNGGIGSGSDSRSGSESAGSSSSGKSSYSRSIITWRGHLDLDRNVEQEILADAIKKGYLHVDMPMTNRKELSKAETLHLIILPPDRDPSTYRLTASSVPDAVPHLLEAAFGLLSRPTGTIDKSKISLRSYEERSLFVGELRSLRSQLAQKDEEIASLSAKLASAKATVVRATASDNSNKKKLLSPVKKTPANASALQPNAKRRRVVEDDFAGSDDE